MYIEFWNIRFCCHSTSTKSLGKFEYLKKQQSMRNSSKLFRIWKRFVTIIICRFHLALTLSAFGTKLLPNHFSSIILLILNLLVKLNNVSFSLNYSETVTLTKILALDLCNEVKKVGINLLFSFFLFFFQVPHSKWEVEETPNLEKITL